MAYLDLFQRYGSTREDADIRLTGYLTRPDTLTAARRSADPPPPS